MDLKYKITIAKLIEVSFYQNGEITTAIALNKDNFKITVDEDGNATLTGKAHNLQFKANKITQDFGAEFKSLSILFTVLPNGKVQYSATYKFIASTFTVNGKIDVEKIILECSGYLCKAARALKSRQSQLNQRILEATL